MAEKVAQQILAHSRQQTFGVELHSLDRELTMPHSHETPSCVHAETSRVDGIERSSTSE
jgi:hypothetical protein